MDDFDYTELTAISVSAIEGDVLLPYTMPQAEYMYGCVCTAVGMLLGYYDKYGYLGYDVSNIIDGDIAVYSRGLDGNKYDMDAFDTVLGNFIATQNYVDMFFETTPEHELQYTFKQDNSLNTDVFDCLASWLGTGQYWRRNGDYSTTYYFAPLDYMLNAIQTYTLDDHELPISRADYRCGLYEYLATVGYTLDTSLTNAHELDVSGGDFTFEDYMAEIDAGRAVLISIMGHMMVGYGYNENTREIIFDDTYEADQRMAWGGTYNYANEDRAIQTIHTIVFDTTGLQKIQNPEADIEEPCISNITANCKTPTQNNVMVTATFSDNVAVTQKQYRIGDNGEWLDYISGVLVTDNAVVYFRAFDAEGNMGEAYYAVTNIDRTPPAAPIASMDFLRGEAPSVVLSAVFDEDSVQKLYSLNGGEWLSYTGELNFTEDGQVVFRAEDQLGNASMTTCTWIFEPEDLSLFNLEIDAPQAGGIAEIHATVDAELSVFQYSLDGGDWLDVNDGLVQLQANGSLQFKIMDTAGNAILTKEYQLEPFNVLLSELQINGSGSCATVDWGEDSTVQWAAGYSARIEANGMAEQFDGLAGDGIDLICASGTDIALSLKPTQSQVWTDVEQEISIAATGLEANILQADANDMTDIVLAGASTTWSNEYLAMHTGYGAWTGTRDTVALAGKNRITDFFLGSDDTSILLLTDDENGDALFVDDIYSALPGQILQQQARIARIDEIRAGAGDDVVDMTSQRFEYAGNGLTIKGGNGNDVIWANRGNNILFGEQGDDQIVGGGENDLIIGGIGNDTMNGGGGDDVFCFCENWGQDTVRQLEGGSVTLWFADGCIDKWNAGTLTYTDGNNSITVIGLAAGDVTLMFEDDDREQFAILLSAGAFC